MLFKLLNFEFQVASPKNGNGIHSFLSLVFENVASMGNSTGKCMTGKKFKQIDKDVWETSKSIQNSLEVKSDDLD